MSEQQSEKKKVSLNIVQNKKNHKGFGAGSIDLSNVSGVVIDGDVAVIDAGTLHARSKIERGIKFTPNKEDVPNGRKCWIVWVAVDRAAEGAFYAGLTACEMLIDTDAKKGWKVLADHVNRMDAAMKRKVMIDELNKVELQALQQCLMSHNEEWWNRSPEEVTEAFQKK